jgi:ferrous iron transport protein B
VAVATVADPAPVTIALAGQPNVGKSTVFNMLTGLSQYVGNWPGKTAEQKTGTCQLNGATVQVVDLPGTYSLSAGSLEERIARDYILQEHPDAVAVIVNAATLERNLYLLAEILQLPVPVVVGLNMVDVAAAEGIHVEAHVLEAALGLPVVPMVTTRNEGVRELLDAARSTARTWPYYAPSRPQIREDHRAVLAEMRSLIAGRVPQPYPEDWAALKLLEGDAEITELMQAGLGADWEPVHALLKQHEDAILAIAGGRYEWIARMVRAAVTRPHAGQITVTDRIDRVVTHPLWGVLILLAVLGVTFWLVYAVGTPLQEMLDHLVLHGGGAWLRQALAGGPPWLGSLVVDGLLAGIGTLLTFLPILLIFFAVLGLLEDVGYIARAAYAADRFMHPMGLHGRSFLPLFLGFGCNVPSVMSARTVNAPKARLLTILLAPFVPCPARVTVVIVLAPAFFGASAPWVAMGMLGMSIAALMVVGIAFHELFLGGEHVAFIMELPLYHLPNPGAIGRSMWERTLDFLRIAGSVILVVSVGLWALSTLPSGDMESSYLAQVGRLLAPIGALMGLGWQMMVALLTSVVRKENVIATLGVLYSTGHEDQSLVQTLHGALTAASGLAFLTLEMLFVPCVATLAAIKKETGGWRWAGLSAAMLVAISLALGLAVYHIARLAGL